MIERVTIQNFRSIEQVILDLGRINVLIGENGAGKSNILEALAYGAAARSFLLSREYLVARGVRVSNPGFIRPAFAEGMDNDARPMVRFSPEHESKIPLDTEHSLLDQLGKLGANQLRDLAQALAGPALKGMIKDVRDDEVLAQLVRALLLSSAPRELQDFLIYSPENASLRNFDEEGQILPLGVRGEGLFAHLKQLSQSEEGGEVLERLMANLGLIDWFERFELPTDLGAGERRIVIRDRFLAAGASFDQRSANEGFLLLLFYLTLFLSKETPSFFAVDNIDASLNPRLCAALMRTLNQLAKDRNKQAILTTHNPALLDGLDLNDDAQRLFVAERTSAGRTIVRRVHPPRAVANRPLVPLSEAFMRGYLGGLPENF